MRTALQEAGIDYDSADAASCPACRSQLDEDGARKVFQLIDALEDSDDVQNVYANFDVSDEVMEKVEPDGRSTRGCADGPTGHIPSARRLVSGDG